MASARALFVMADPMPTEPVTVWLYGTSVDLAAEHAAGRVSFEIATMPGLQLITATPRWGETLKRPGVIVQLAETHTASEIVWDGGDPGEIVRMDDTGAWAVRDGHEELPRLILRSLNDVDPLQAAFIALNHDLNIEGPLDHLKVHLVRFTVEDQDYIAWFV